MLQTHVLLSSFGAEGAGLPTEFRLFRRGSNQTSKGTFVFDDLAAQSVMTSFRQEGTRGMFDLEHLSLDTRAPNYDPDARGWYDLEVRNGELWAVNVNWTPDGQRRLTEKTQVYTSPAFDVDEQGRVTKVYNVAITAMPATYAPAALVAASKGQTMTPEMLQKALEALKNGDAEAAMALLEEAIVAQAAGEPAPEAKPEDAPVESMADAPNDEQSKDEKTKEPEAAIAASILASVGAVSVDEIKAWKLAAEESAKVKAGVELASRRVLIGELVKLGVETPATAWKGEAKDRDPCERLSSEPLADMQKRVSMLRESGKGKEIKPPTKTQEVTLSKAELDACKARNLDPKVYAERKAAAVRRSN
jgi:hypothetical protein